MKLSVTRILALILLSVIPAVGLAQNLFTISGFNIEPGQTKTISLNLENDIPFVGFQAELLLPDGVRAVQSNGKYATLTSRASSTHTLSVNASDPTHLRMICMSASHDLIATGNGALVNVTLQAEPSFSGGEVKLVNIIFADEQDKDVDLPDVSILVGTKEENTLSADEMQIYLNTPLKYDVSLNNETEFSAFQFDIELPENIEIVDGTLEATGRIAGHTLRMQKLAPNTYRVLAYSTDNKLIEGHNGPLLSFTVKAVDSQPEIGTAKITNALFSKANAKEVHLDDVSIAAYVFNPDSGVSDIASDGYSISIIDNQIKVSSTDAVAVSIFNMAGCEIYSGNGEDIPQFHGGVYILLVNDKCHKLLLK